MTGGYPCTGGHGSSGLLVGVRRRHRALMFVFLGLRGKLATRPLLVLLCVLLDTPDNQHNNWSRSAIRCDKLSERRQQSVG